MAIVLVALAPVPPCQSLAGADAGGAAPIAGYYDPRTPTFTAAPSI